MFQDPKSRGSGGRPAGGEKKRSRAEASPRGRSERSGRQERPADARVTASRKAAGRTDTDSRRQARSAQRSGGGEKRQSKALTYKDEKTQSVRPAKKRRKFLEDSGIKEEFKHLSLSFNRDALRPDDIFRVKGGFDRPMFLIILILVCFGSVMVFTSSYAYALHKYGDSYYFIRRQLMYVLVGIAAMLFVAAFVDYRWIRFASRFYFPLMIVMLVAVLLIGESEGDAKRWLNLGFVQIQPSEFMKLSLVLTLADLYSIVEKQVRDRRFWVSSAFGTFLPTVLLAVVCGLIALENHISGTIIMFLIGVLIIFCGGGKLVWLFGVGGAFAGAVAAIIAMTGYASKRLDIWLHPENYSSQSEVWQTLQGLYAVGSGGMLGVGLGESRQKHLFISQPQNDFIFAVICEELGFVGAICVIALFAALIWRGFKIAVKAPDTFSRLTVIGIVGKVGIQALLNIAVVTASIPNTGVTLPFFSYGGSSLTVLMVEMGVVLAISRYSTEQK